MPPKSPAKPASAPEPSSAPVPWRLKVSDLDLNENDMPSFLGKPMSVLAYAINFAAVWWFRPGRRCLVDAEIEGINSIMHGGKKASGLFYHISAKLRDPNLTASRVLQDFTNLQKVGLRDYVARPYAKLLREDPEALERYRSLVGFTGTLPEIPLRNERNEVRFRIPTLQRRQWNREKNQEEIVRHVLREDELFSVYALVNLCKDSEGNDITESDVTTIVRGKLRYVISKDNALFERFKRPTDALTMAVAAAFENLEVARFFTERVMGWLSEYFNAGVLKSKAPYYPPTTINTSQSDPIATTTDLFTAFTMGVTAPPAPSAGPSDPITSRQVTDRNTAGASESNPFDFEQYIDWNAVATDPSLNIDPNTDWSGENPALLGEEEEPSSSSSDDDEPEVSENVKGKRPRHER